jgi:hypothetical protein
MRPAAGDGENTKPRPRGWERVRIGFSTHWMSSGEREICSPFQGLRPGHAPFWQNSGWLRRAGDRPYPERYKYRQQTAHPTLQGYVHRSLPIRWPGPGGPPRRLRKQGARPGGENHGRLRPADPTIVDKMTGAVPPTWQLLLPSLPIWLASKVQQPEQPLKPLWHPAILPMESPIVPEREGIRTLFKR